MSAKISASTMGIKVTSGLPASVSNYSMMAWFTVRSQTTFGSFLALGGSTSGIFHNMSIDSAALNTLVYNASADSAAGTVITLNRRIHIALTSDGTTVRGYINGVQACSVAFNSIAAPTAAWFGSDTDAEWLDCDVEDPRMFNRCLRSMEIRQEMMSDVVLNRAVCTFGARLLDQTDLRYRTGRFNNGVLFGSPTRGTDLRGARAGISIAALVPLLQAAIGAGSQTISPNGLIGQGIYGAFAETPGPVTLSMNSLISQAIFAAFAGTSNYPITMNALVAQAVFGTQVVTPGAFTVSPNSLLAQIIFGSFSATGAGGLQTVSPDSLMGQGIFGSFVLAPGAVTLAPDGLVSMIVYGADAVTPGAVAVSPQGLVGQADFGTFTVSPGSVTLSLTGLVGQGKYGSFQINLTISPSGLVATAVLAGQAVTVGAVTLTRTGFVLQTVFGAINVAIPSGAAQIVQNASLWIGLGIRM